MNYVRGQVVKSLKGHDAGEYFVVTDAYEKYVLVANGKTRRIASPKKKNIKHISPSEEKLINLEAQTDKTLRRLINIFKMADKL